MDDPQTNGNINAWNDYEFMMIYRTVFKSENRTK